MAWGRFTPTYVSTQGEEPSPPANSQHQVARHVSAPSWILRLQSGFQMTATLANIWTTSGPLYENPSQNQTAKPPLNF